MAIETCNAALVMGAECLRKFWQKEPIASSPERGWDSWTLPHRQTIPVAMRCLNARSVYEIGCGSGANLRLLRECAPTIPLAGSDIREEYVRWARDQELDVECHVMPHLVTALWDVTLSCYTLAYLHPPEVIEQLGKIDSRALVLMEPTGAQTGVALTTVDSETGAMTCPVWLHNWAALLKETGWLITWRWPIWGPNSLETLMICERG